MGCCSSRDKTSDDFTCSVQEQIANIYADKEEREQVLKRIKLEGLDEKIPILAVKLFQDKQDTTSENTESDVNMSQSIDDPDQSESEDDIIEEVLHLNKSNFDDAWSKLYEDDKCVSYLQIYGHQIDNPQQNTKVNVTRAEFIMPCKPKEYIDFMNDTVQQCKLDSGKMDAYLAFEQQNLMFKIYLSYKKFLLVSARDFVYEKKIKLIDVEGDVWCDASSSIEDQRYPVDPKKVRGIIEISGNTVQPLKPVIDQQGISSRFALVKDPENYCLVRTYTHCDFKMNFSLNMAKGQIVSEMKTYIEKVFQYFKTQKQ